MQGPGQGTVCRAEGGEVLPLVSWQEVRGKQQTFATSWETALLHSVADSGSSLN